MLISRTEFSLQQRIGRGGWFQNILAPLAVRRPDELSVSIKYQTRFGLYARKGNSSYVTGILLRIRTFVVRAVEGQDMRHLPAVKQ